MQFMKNRPLDLHCKNQKKPSSKNSYEKVEDMNYRVAILKQLAQSIKLVWSYQINSLDPEVGVL